MGRKIRLSKEKQMKPNFFVFCEGKTEMAYIKFLRSLYRVPIQVIPKKGKSNISKDDIGRTRGQVPVSHICDETGMKQVPVPMSD